MCLLPENQFYKYSINIKIHLKIIESHRFLSKYQIPTVLCKIQINSQKNKQKLKNTISTNKHN